MLTSQSRKLVPSINAFIWVLKGPKHRVVFWFLLLFTSPEVQVHSKRQNKYLGVDSPDTYLCTTAASLELPKSDSEEDHSLGREMEKAKWQMWDFYPILEHSRSPGLDK